jgi:Flp pilus assembly pilin Flp
MDRIRTLARKFVKSDEGIAVTEYGLLIALVAVLLIGVVTIFVARSRAGSPPRRTRSRRSNHASRQPVACDPARGWALDLH